MLRLKKEMSDSYVYSYTSGQDDNGRPYEVRIGVSKEPLKISYIIPRYMMKDDTELIIEACVAIFKEIETRINKD